MTEKLNLFKKLSAVQNELKAPKGQTNKFGNYRYRSCEDILESVKPINYKYGAAVTLTDKIVLIGDRYYVEATATFIDTESQDTYSVSASAREDEIKKGMDLSQITGSTSSYARKYALNGLYDIDDTKDSDATNKHGKDSDDPQDDDTPKTETKTDRRAEELQYSNTKKCSEAQATAIALLATGDKLKNLLAYYKAPLVSDLTELQAHDAIDILKKNK